MDKLEKLINEKCPNGVEYKHIEEIANYRRGSFPQPYTDTRYYGGEDAMPFVQVADVLDNMSLVKKTKQTISKLAQPKSIFVKTGTVIISLQGTIGRVAITQYDCYVDRTIAIFESYKIKIDKKYFAYQLQNIFEKKKKYARGSTIKTITKEEFSKFKIAVPPIEVQEEIVKILDYFAGLSKKLTEQLEAELKLRQHQYEYYRNKLLSFDESAAGLDTLHTHTHGYFYEQELKWLKLSEILTIKNGKDYKHLSNGKYPVYGTGGVMTYVNEFAYDKPSVLIPRKGSLNKVYYVEEPFWNVDTIYYTIIDSNIVIPKYIYYILSNMHLEKLNIAGGIPSLTQSTLNKLSIPVPSLEIQEKIVNILDKFDKLTNDIAEGLPAEIEARQKQYEYYRNKLLSFKESKTA